MEHTPTHHSPGSNRLTFMVLLSLTALLLFNACGKQQEVREYKFDEAFAPYVAAYTSKTISRQSEIQVQLSQDIPGEAGTLLADNPFSFSPEIKGQARLINPRTIAFEPKVALPSNTYYTATFQIQKFIENLPEELKDFSFNFETMRQTFTVDLDGLETIDSKELKWQRVKGLLTTADYETEENVEGLLEAKQKGKALKVSWNHSLDGITHHFVVDSIRRRTDPSEVELAWNGDALGIDLEGSKQVTIPAQGDFKVLDNETFNDPEQYLKLKFSDPLKANQDLKGLIQIDDLDLRFVINGNIVEVYPRDRTTGEHTLTVNRGIRNVLGYKLQEEKTFEIQFEELKPQVRLVGNGVILPRQGSTLPFAFETVNLKSVDIRVTRIFEDNILQFLQVNNLNGSSELNRVGKRIHTSEIRLDEDKTVSLRRWNRQVVDLSTLINPEPGAIYQIELDFDEDDSSFPCESMSQAEASEEEEDDYYYYYDEEYYERYRNRDNPCHEAYYTFQDRSVSRNVLASDLGMMAKMGTDDAMTMVVTDLHTTQPISGVQLELYDFQQQLIGTYTTDAEGMATSKPEETPYVMVAKQGDQRGYLKLQDGLALSMSKFDIAGQRYHQGVKGYIYGERGVWRPGDTLFVSFMLQDKLKSLPEDHPVNFSLTNPRGQVVKKESRSIHLNGVYTFQYATASSAPTGNYQLNVQVGGATFEKTLKVETVVPNRLKIELGFEQEYLAAGEEAPKAKMQIRWLHGAIAKNLAADISVNLKERKTSFETYQKYSFDDPVRHFESERTVIFDGQVDENGQADVPMKISVGNEAPGMLTASFVTKVFEPGGNFSTDRFNIPYYPYEKFVGVKVPKGKGYRGAIVSEDEITADIVSVDHEGKANGTETVEATLYRLDWRWWWDHSARNITNFNEKFYREKVSTKKIKLTNGKGKYTFATGDWGRYLLRVVHPDGHATGTIFFAEYPWWRNREDKKSGPGGATMLTFAADKEEYKVGETITLNIPMGQESRALVSIESGSQVIKTTWIQPLEGKNSTEYSFTATADMAPNVYAHVTLIQPHAQSANDLPIRLYGVTPLKVTDPMTVLKPKIATPATFRPMEKATVKVSEANGKGMTYTVAVVDEGLLDLTRFRTPDPWNTFYAREALDVKTWDLYDQVSGAYGADITKLLGIGGGDGIGPKEGTKVNRFRPVVKFLGPFELKPGETATHTFTMPNYVGSVRTMVVARDEEAYGSAEKATPVRKPLMVLGTLPRVLGPGEEVTLPISVFAMEDHVKNVSIGLQAGDLFEIQGVNKKDLQFSRPGDEMVTFKLKVAEKVGTSSVKVVAVSGKETATYHIDIEVRNPNPPMKKVAEAVLENNNPWKHDFKFHGMEGTNSGMLEISRIPAINLHGRLRYLIHYPYGCVEQTTSSVLPQLYVGELLDLNSGQKTEIDKNIRAGIRRLKRFQTDDGGLAYWPGGSQTNDWGTNYAGRFLVEAKRKGYRIPDDFFNGWLKYQKKTARNWSDAYQNGDIIQAERLFLLALAGSPELGSMNRLRERANTSVPAKWRLATAYHLAGQPEMALKISKGLTRNVGYYTQYGYHYGSNIRDHALILECLAIMNRRSEGKDIAETLSKQLSSNMWMNTQATGFSLIAMARFTGQDQNSNQALHVEYRINGGNWIEVKTGKAISQVEIPTGKLKGGTVEVRKKSGTIAYTRLILEGTPVAGDQDASQSNLKMTLAYYDLEGDRIDVSRMEQGTDFIAEVTLTNPGEKGDLDEMVLNQIFPSGWEIHNSRLDGIDWGDEIAVPEYQDIRDDRIYTFFDLGDGYQNGWWYWYGRREEPKTKTFRVMLNASYLGRFYLPSVYAEAMYDATVNARIPGQWVEVVGPDPS